MDVAFSIPEDIGRRLEAGGRDLSRQALEGIAAQAYRNGTLTLGEVRRLLGHASRMETEAFLKERGALLDYTEEELERDLEAALQGSPLDVPPVEGVELTLCDIADGIRESRGHAYDYRAPDEQP